MEPISNAYFNFSSGHQAMSSKGFIKTQRKVSISNTNEAIKKSLVILMHNISPSHQGIIGYSSSQYSSKAGGSFSKDIQEEVPKNLPSVNAPSIHLHNHIRSIQSGVIKTCILIHA
ncbi:hypothetical protein O181_026733 [Austropuccinia psidii MF-1]|uniref:Uncharacterized protein n=1 Tax=Austropuccinia psidii MF-1 TaxID=1389203 RepID=A0A9Q3CQD3_9BASI|nr:hypothetical protein [Austropuccinia psidii MF-1]